MLIILSIIPIRIPSFLSNYYQVNLKIVENIKKGDGPSAEHFPFLL